MGDILMILNLLRYSRPSEWPSLVKYALFKAIHHPARIDLKLRGQQWVAMTAKPSGLRFFWEVVVGESYAIVRRDLLALPNPLVIDGGANCGAFALWALSVNPKAQVISFEPGEAFENLSINRGLYVSSHGDQWQVEKCALSSKVGMARFSQLPNSSMGVVTDAGAELVPVRTVDDLGLSPEILKIDVEGCELEVLKGSESTLKTAKTVVLEYHSEELRTQCMEFLASRNFVLEEERMLIIGRR